MGLDKLLVVVPARGGSKRLPGKNLRALAGRTLVERTAVALRDSGVRAPCLLSTDDERIADAGRAVGWLVPFLRPAALADDQTTTVPVVRHALDWYRNDCGSDPDILMILQLTSPFRTAATISQGLALLASHPDMQAVVSMARIDRAPRHLFVIDGAGRAVPLAEADGPKPIHTPNGALYLIRTEVFRASDDLFPPRTAALELDVIESIDVDDEADWRLAEAVAAQQERG